MANPPYFALYPKDWLSDPKVRRLRRSARADYFDLVCHMWASGKDSIRDNDREIARVLGLSLRSWVQSRQQIMDPEEPLFDRTKGRLVSGFLKTQRKAMKAFTAKRSAAGKAGAAARWHSNRNGNRNAAAMPRNGFSSSSSSASSSSREKNPPTPHAESPEDDQVKALAARFWVRIPGMRKPPESDILAFFREIADKQTIGRLRDWVQALVASKCTTIPLMTMAWNDWEENHPYQAPRGPRRSAMERIIEERKRAGH